MPPTTKDRILEAGAEIIHQKGYNHTGIQEILSAANVPKGSFYNYFKNKEDFGLQIIDRFQCQFDRMAKDILEDRSIPPLKRIDRFLRASMDHFQTSNYTGGCPIGNLAQEMGDLSPAFRKKLKEAMDMMVDAYTRVLVKAQSTGEISERLDINETAYFIVAGWHGAIIQMKLTKNPAPLETHRKFIFDHVLKTQSLNQTTAKETIMEEKYKTHGALSWCELMTNDVAAAKKFYTEVLGWTAEEMPMEGMNYTVLKAGEEAVGGILPVPPEAQGTPPHWGVYITVADVDAVAAKAQERGAKTLVPLTDVPDVGRLYTFQDPQGAVISVITYADMES